MAVAGNSSEMHDRLVQVREDLDALLERYNPGEKLSWNVADDAFDLPPETLRQLREVGPILSDFFAAANRLFYRDANIAARLEKRITPHYAMLNRCQPDAVPRLLRPDVVCDLDWTPKLVELEITVGARADTSLMAQYYGLDRAGGLVAAYVAMANDYASQGMNLALVTAPHPFFLDLPDDARAFAAILREAGVTNLSVITAENLPSLRFDGEHLWLNERFEAPRIIHAIDRFIDIYEIAELQHPGMGAILDAYLAGRLIDVNTVKQFLDEKDWMSVFWDPDYRDYWDAEIGRDRVEALRRFIPRTWILREDLMVELKTGEKVAIRDLSALPREHRSFIVKESGTSTTSSGAQSFAALVEMEGAEIDALIKRILDEDVEFILQEMVESPRVSYREIDPYTDETALRTDARFKLSPFYIDGELSDIRFVASNKLVAVNNDEQCVVGVVRR